MHKDFHTVVWNYYEKNKREMPWRNLNDLSEKDRGYNVLVSEVMLQQTQVNRVIEKYTQWMERWPTIEEFAEATLSDVLVMWNGLGYNRRAKYLLESLTTIHKDYGGIVPMDQSALQDLPGIGPNTAAAIIVYTYNKPIPFVETNIRTVYLHSYYADSDSQVTDNELLTLVKETLDKKNPRDWFYALMDYGAYLKKNHGNQLHRAKAYKKQSVFSGSKRQIRGKVLHLLTKLQYIHKDELIKEIADDRLHDVIENLIHEGMIVQLNDGSYTLPNR